MQRIIGLLVVLLVAACSSIRVSSDFDREANFAGYKTYAYTEDAQQLPIDDLNKRRIFSAIDKELTAKGFSKSDNTDVLNDLKQKDEQK
jgi:hypothetical protein